MAHQHLRVIGGLPTPTVVVGVHDSAPGRAKAFAAAAGTRVFASLDALLSEARPDVVHVCTPPAAHFDAAYAALDAGAHVYVEKPFALTASDARGLLSLAFSRDRLACAGHQLLYDPAYRRVTERAGELGTLLQADSHFAFRPPGRSTARWSTRALAQQLVDILPHPLYSLVAAMERAIPDIGSIELTCVHATPTAVHALLRAGDIVGRLSVSLLARPVASSLTLTGTAGSLTCDFVRSTVVGAANPGIEALEKVFNPVVEGSQLASRTAASMLRRIRSGAGYPGLAELMGAFYGAVNDRGWSPVPSMHLIRVTDLFQVLVARIEAAVQGRVSHRPSLPGAVRGGAKVVVTGARGFLGAEIARALSPVRGIGRAAACDDPHVTEWVAADLSQELPSDRLAGAEIVVHAAAETAGGYDDHRRNTIAATRRLLDAMHAAGVRKLLLVSSLSVLAPPRSPWERQNEETPRARRPRPLGPYTWGKCLQEELVERDARARGIDVRIVRPGALLDWNDPTLPGLMGRRLFGRWHLGLGRPDLPMAVCDVESCAEVIASCVRRFDDIPPVVHIFDPNLMTRGALLTRLGALGWRGRVVWVPISVVAAGLTAVRTLLSLGRLRLPARLSVWSILRPRRYDATRAAEIWRDVRREARVCSTRFAPDAALLPPQPANAVLR
jgi:predicted dehydrogenase/nucleoside-diphosphate-sugar epimerase